MNDNPRSTALPDLTRDRQTGPSRGWSLESVATWLYTEGRFIADPMTMIEVLMELSLIHISEPTRPY